MATDGIGEGRVGLSADELGGSVANQPQPVLRESPIWTRAVIEDIETKAEVGRYRYAGMSLHRAVPSFDGFHSSDNRVFVIEFSLTSRASDVGRRLAGIFDDSRGLAFRGAHLARKPSTADSSVTLRTSRQGRRASPQRVRLKRSRAGRTIAKD